ncbi:flagellar motor protein MotB [Sphingosinicella sp.]|uniref:flagellar motor protein MotB n=1 Tax=Sphingosinicella sp. TaxID=1917971 RepID=UPI0040380FA7
MSGSVPRWAVSFADLVLLLLGCFVLLHAMESQRPKADDAASMPRTTAPAGQLLAADSLFEAGEARLTEAGRSRLLALAGSLRGGGATVSGRGVSEAGLRLDRFELAAARAAAVARALREGGIAEAAIAVGVDNAPSGRPGQTIAVARR